VRIHLGHHFYGAGNLGDDFMLAGFLAAMRTMEPAATLSCCVPFPLPPLRQRFPDINWLPYDPATRARSVQECDLWLGLGGSPFQHALSRWFVDHLVDEAEMCARENTPMYFLGIGVQTDGELNLPEVQRICAQAAGIWTRDSASAERLRALPSAPRVEAAADLAHVFFRETPPPPAHHGRVTLVANFDYGAWPAQRAFLDALYALPAREHTWLAQESRNLPGAERALYAALPPADRSRWQLVSPDTPGTDLPDVLATWPSAEWLLTARYHAALAGAWAGSKVIVLSTNEKLRAASVELGAPLLAPDADQPLITRALQQANVPALPHASAERAYDACAALLRSAVAHQR
jgi:polysaccharide pyruvyl transferase WcaK-like protein